MGHGELSDSMVAGLDAWYAQSLPADTTSRILDYGCGCGDFIEYVQRKGFQNVEGADINPALAELSRKRTGCDIFQIEDFDALCAEREGQYAFINLKDVLEHIPKDDAIGFLSGIRRMLADGGQVYVSIPQMSGFTSLYTMFNDYTHVTLFTRSSLRYVLESSGFSTLSFVTPRVPFSFNPATMLFRSMRWLWFRIVRLIYMLERPGEQMPETSGDRLSVVAS